MSEAKFSTVRDAQAPSEAHARLAPMVGEWRVRMSVWTEGQDPPLQGDVRASKTWINGGRHVREEVIGPFAGGEHAKLAVLGYNNLRGRYEFTTADNSDPVIMFYTGQWVNDQLVLEGDFVAPVLRGEVLGELIRITIDIQVEDEDHHRQTITYTHPNGRTYRFLEYRYTRLRSEAQ